MRYLILLLLAGCLNTEETYDCVLVYHSGDEIKATYASVVASSEDVAQDLATLEFLAEPPSDWVWVRPFCKISRAEDE